MNMNKLSSHITFFIVLQPHFKMDILKKYIPLTYCTIYKCAETNPRKAQVSLIIRSETVSTTSTGVENSGTFIS